MTGAPHKQPLSHQEKQPAAPVLGSSEVGASGTSGIKDVILHTSQSSQLELFISARTHFNHTNMATAPSGRNLLFSSTPDATSEGAVMNTVTVSQSRRCAGTTEAAELIRAEKTLLVVWAGAAADG